MHYIYIYQINSQISIVISCLSQGAAELIEASRKTQLNACHLATIWALDADGDGLVSRRDVEAFFHSVLPQAEHCRDDELQAGMVCLLQREMHNFSERVVSYARLCFSRCARCV